MECRLLRIHTQFWRWDITYIILGYEVTTRSVGGWEIICSLSKTESPSRRKSVTSVRVGHVIVPSSPVVRDLGVMIDSAGSREANVFHVCSAASHALWRISKIRNLIDHKTTEKLIHGFVTSRLDYCNSLLFGLPAWRSENTVDPELSGSRGSWTTDAWSHFTRPPRTALAASVSAHQR